MAGKTGGGTRTQDPPPDLGPVPGATGPAGGDFASSMAQMAAASPAARDVTGGFGPGSPPVPKRIQDSLAGVQTGPAQPDPAVARLEKVWAKAKGTLPTDVALALSQSDISDHEVARAAVHLARWYEVPPAYLLRPVSSLPGFGPDITYYQDPTTGQLMTLATARRVMRPEEPLFFAKALANYISNMGGLPSQVRVGEQAAAARGIAPNDVGAVTPAKLARVVKAMRPVDGTQVDFTQAIGAAFSIVADGTNLKNFESNLVIAAKASGLTPSEQIAVAHDATQKGLKWTDENQLLAFLNPTTGAAYAQVAPLIAQVKAIQDAENLFEQTKGAQGTAPGIGAIQIRDIYNNHPELLAYQRDFQGSSGQVGALNFGTPHDYGAELRSALDSKIGSYDVKAAGIATQWQLDSQSFGHTFLGHVLHDANQWVGDGVRGTFAGIMYTGGAAVTAVASPFGLGPKAWRITMKDAQDIWHGNATEGSLFADAVGAPKWVGVTFDLYTQWYLSPDVLAGRGVSYLHEADVAATAGTKVDAFLNMVGLGHLSNTGSLEAWTQRATDFVDKPRVLFGNESLVEHTRNILLAAENPEAAWAHLRDQMWMRYGNAAVDSRVVNGMWSAAKVAHSSGADVATLDQTIRDVWLAGFGAKPFTGSTAEAVLQHAASIENPDIQQQLLDAIDAAPTEQKAAEALRAAEANSTYASAALDQLTMDYGLTSNGYLRSPRMLQEIPKISLGHNVATYISDSAIWEHRFPAAIRREFTRLPGRVFNLEDRYATDIESYMRSAPTMPWSKAEIAQERLVAESIANDTTSVDREAKFLTHQSRIQSETITRMGRSLGYSADDAARIAQEGMTKIGKLNDNLLSDVYGVHRTPTGTVESFDEPLVSTQLLNQRISLDPVTVYKTMAHHVGIAKRLDALALRSTMPGISELESTASALGFHDLSAAMEAVKGGTTDSIDLAQRLADAAASGDIVDGINADKFMASVTRLNKQIEDVTSRRSLTGALADTAGVAADSFNRAWKPLAVLRPAYVVRGPFLDEQLRTWSRIGFTSKMNGYQHNIAWIARRSEEAVPVSMAGVVGGLGKEVIDPVEAMVRSYGYSDLPGALDALKAFDNEPLGDVTGPISRMSEADVQSLRDIAAQIPRDINLTLPGLLFPEGDQLANTASYRQAFERIQGSAERDAARLAKGKGYQVLDPTASGSQGYIGAAWASALNDQIGQSELGRYALGQIQRGIPLDQRAADMVDWLANDPGELAGIANRELARMGKTGQEEEATRRLTEVTDSYTQGSDRIAAAAANHQVTADLWNTLKDKPLVHGPRAGIDSGFTSHPVATAKDFFSKYLMELPHDLLNRQPFYRANADLAGKAMLRHASESGMTITPEFLSRVKAESRNFALGEVRRVLIDYSVSNRLEDTLSFIAPFFKPWENGLLRWGKLIKDKPALLGYIRVLNQAGHDSGFLRTNAETGQTEIPLTWWMGGGPLLQHMFHVGGWQISAPLASLNLFFSDTMGVPTGTLAGQFPLPMPALGPVGTWTLQHILLNDHSPVPEGVRETLIPWATRYGQESLTSLEPTWLKYALNAGNPSNDPNWMTAQTDNFLKMQAYMGITAETLMRDNPTWSRDQAQAQLVKMAETNARQYAGFRSFASAFFPAAPSVSFPQAHLNEELGALLKANPDNPSAAYDAFNAAHPGMELLTVSKTIVNTDNQLASPIRLPATDSFAKLMRQPGFKEFAKQYPQWLWAVIPPEVQDGKFDPGVYFSQIADGLIKYRTPVELLQQGDLQKAWGQYWPIHDSWQAHSEQLQAQGFTTTSDTYMQAKGAEYDQPLSQLAEIYPVWGRNYGPTATSLTMTLGLDPHVLATARSLLHNQTFMDAPSDIGQALASYLDLRDRVYSDLRDHNISSVTNADATTLGISQTYADGVAKIEAEFPNSNFKQAYQAFFSKDLQKIATSGASLLKQVGSDPARQAAFDSWNKQWAGLTSAVKQANLQGEQDSLYFQMNQLSDQAFSQADTTGFNPQMVWWNTRTPGQQETYKMGLYSRPYGFLSRFDRQVVLGETVTAQTEAEWSQIGQLQAQIGLMGDKGQGGTSKIYAYIDKLALGFAAKDPAFAQQVANANTWGYTFFKTTPYLDSSHTTSGTWGSWKGAVQQMQTVADQYQLNGAGSFDPAKKAAYAYLKGQLINYLDQLEQADPQFSREVADIQDTNGSTRFVDYFMPANNFPVGGFLKSGGALTNPTGGTP